MVSYNFCPFICELYKDFYIFYTKRPNSMSLIAGSEYEEIIMTSYDPRVHMATHNTQLNMFSSAEDEKELPSTVTFLVSPEQARVLAELELDSKLHLALVYRGDADTAAEFIAAQDDLITALYAEPDVETETVPAESEAAE